MPQDDPGRKQAIRRHTSPHGLSSIRASTGVHGILCGWQRNKRSTPRSIGRSKTDKMTRTRYH